MHRLSPDELLRLAELSPGDALREGLMQSLRADAEFVAGIGGDQQFAIMAVQALLALGNEAGRAGVELSAAAVMAQRTSTQPPTATGMREQIAPSRRQRGRVQGRHSRFDPEQQNSTDHPNMNEILEEDVLRGCKTIAAETRDGNTVDVDCRALSWAASCKVMSLAVSGGGDAARDLERRGPGAGQG